MGHHKAEFKTRNRRWQGCKRCGKVACGFFDPTGFGAFATAQRTIQGYEAMHMIRKGQIEAITKRNVLAQTEVINRLFGLAA